MQSHVLPEPRIAEEVGQLLAKPIMRNLRAFSRSVSFIRGLLRSEHVWTKKYGSFRKTRLSRYNTARKYIYCCDPYFDEALTIASLPFLRLHVIYCHFCFLDKPSKGRACIIANTEALISKLDGLKYPCVVNVKASVIFEPFKVNKL